MVVSLRARLLALIVCSSDLKVVFRYGGLVHVHHFPQDLPVVEDEQG
jgi:hypothetical protein